MQASGAEHLNAAAVLWAWTAILGLGMFHGLNPGMGWLFAVSNGMQTRSSAGVLLALAPLALGHLLAIAAVLMSLSVVAVYVAHFTVLKLVAAFALVGLGLYRLLNLRRHPRLLARIGRRHLVLWSFLMATSHGTGLMLAPIVLGLEDSGVGMRHASHVAEIAHGSLAIATFATLLHTVAMIVTAGTIAWLVYRRFGLGMLQKSWFNVDLLWACCLVLVGLVAMAV